MMDSARRRIGGENGKNGETFVGFPSHLNRRPREKPSAEMFTAICTYDPLFIASLPAVLSQRTYPCVHPHSSECDASGTKRCLFSASTLLQIDLCEPISTAFYHWLVCVFAITKVDQCCETQKSANPTILAYQPKSRENFVCVWEAQAMMCLLTLGNPKAWLLFFCQHPL